MIKVLAAISLVLCVATAAVWIDSYSRQDGPAPYSPSPPAGWRWVSAQGSLTGRYTSSPVPLAAVRNELPSEWQTWTTIIGGIAGGKVHGRTAVGPFGLFSYGPGLVLNGTTASRLERFDLRYKILFWCFALGVIPAIIAWLPSCWSDSEKTSSCALHAATTSAPRLAAVRNADPCRRRSERVSSTSISSDRSDGRRSTDLKIGIGKIVCSSARERKYKGGHHSLIWERG